MAAAKPSKPTSVAATLRQIKDLPGSRGWPLLGNTFQITPACVHLDVKQWAQLFGPVFRMRLGRTQQLVIADHESFVRCVAQKSSQASTRMSSYRGRARKRRDRVEVGIPEADHHQRRLVADGWYRRTAGSEHPSSSRLFCDS